MTLLSSLRFNVKQSGIIRYERAVQRYLAAVRNDPAVAEWRASIVESAIGVTFSFTSLADSYAELLKREQYPVTARRLLGESAGDALLEEAGAQVESSSTTVRRIRDDLSTLSLPLKETPAVILLTRLNVRPGGQAVIEGVIRRVTEATQKIGAPRRVSVSSTLIGDTGEYFIAQPINDPAELDRQKSPAEVLAEAFGDKEASAVLAASAGVLERVTTMLAIPRPDLSNTRQ